MLGRKPLLKATIQQIMGANRLMGLKKMNEKFKRRNAILPAAPGMDIVPPSSGTQIVNYEGLD